MSESFVTTLYCLSAVFAILVIAAAVFDIRKFMIPNTIVIGIIALFAVMAVVLPMGIDWLSHIGAALTVLFVGLVAYRFKFMGAGDIKLVTALSLWAGFELLPIMLITTALAGGALTIGLLIVRKGVLGFPALAGKTTTFPRVLIWAEPIPYGVAISAGAFQLLTKSPYLLGYL